MLAVVVIAAVGFRYRRPATAASAHHTIVAVTDVANIHGDTAMNWLEDGLPQIITDNLSSEGGVDVVSQEQVRDVLLRRGTMRDAPLTAQDAIDVARRVGATVEVRGGISGGQGMYVLDVAARDVGTGATLASFTVMSADPVQLGRLAAARLLDVASVPSGGAAATPRFADVATTRPEAYRHYVLALRAASEQRYGDELRELDAAIALDSGFYGALRDRRDFAAGTGDAALAARLDSAIARHADRMSNWDRLVSEINDAYSSGAVERSEALAERLVERYPRDPRAYDVRGSVLAIHGRWLAADSVYQQELSLDSLAIEAGNGPCAPCDAYSGLVNVRLQSGDVQGAEQAARRWVALQPGVPGAWETLSMVLGFTNRGTEAAEAARRAAALSSDPVNLAFMGRNLIVGHRFAAVDSLIAAMRAHPGARGDADDLAATLARERGQFRKAVVELQPTIPQNGLRLVQADNLMRVGRLAEARREYETAGHETLPRDVETLTAEQARAFTWAHALEGDALWRIGDTSATRALLDSVRRVGARSYYGRDWNLYRHLAGLLALSAGDTARAVRELSAARFGVSGWTTTVVELGRIQLARGDAAGAIALFRQALEGPLDAMGRYVPRSEIEYDLARAFARAGEGDSARVYAQWVRTAWRDADPEVRAKLKNLPN
ncbi:MAG TPA: hypothetical protein VFT41_06040 [Gemmatimonadaceae bacterium]|nr:hypothetical protein [Gemmatimonadaceae bacterium]